MNFRDSFKLCYLVLINSPAKVKFVEVPTDTTVLLGTEATLKCVTSSRVEKCTWMWKPLHSSDSEIVVDEFPSSGDLGRDCSLYLPQVYAEKQGHWTCQVSIASLNTVLTSPSIKVTIFEQGRHFVPREPRAHIYVHICTQYVSFHL